LSIRDEVAKLIGSESAAHKRLIEYVVRQLKSGRDLDAVLDDPYITNRATNIDRRALLEEPEVVEAAGGAMIDDLRAKLEDLMGGTSSG
jgi:hypothetical protein